MTPRSSYPPWCGISARSLRGHPRTPPSVVSCAATAGGGNKDCGVAPIFCSPQGPQRSSTRQPDARGCGGVSPQRPRRYAALSVRTMSEESPRHGPDPRRNPRRGRRRSLDGTGRAVGKSTHGNEANRPRPSVSAPAGNMTYADHKLRDRDDRTYGDHESPRRTRAGPGDCYRARSAHRVG